MYRYRCPSSLIKCIRKFHLPYAELLGAVLFVWSWGDVCTDEKFVTLVYIISFFFCFLSRS